MESHRSALPCGDTPWLVGSAALPTKAEHSHSVVVFMLAMRFTLPLLRAKTLSRLPLHPSFARREVGFWLDPSTENEASNVPGAGGRLERQIPAMTGHIQQAPAQVCWWRQCLVMEATSAGLRDLEMKAACTSVLCGICRSPDEMG